MASIDKAKAVATINAGGTVQEGVTRKKVDGISSAVPVLRLIDSNSQIVGTLTPAVFGHLLYQKVIRRADNRPNVYVKAD